MQMSKVLYSREWLSLYPSLSCVRISCIVCIPLDTTLVRIRSCSVSFLCVSLFAALNPLCDLFPSLTRFFLFLLSFGTCFFMIQFDSFLLLPFSVYLQFDPIRLKSFSLSLLSLYTLLLSCNFVKTWEESGRGLQTESKLTWNEVHYSGCGFILFHMKTREKIPSLPVSRKTFPLTSPETLITG